MILICLAAKAFSQPSCETLRKKQFDVTDTASFRSFVNSLSQCGFDSVDVFVLQPTLPVIVSGLLMKDISVRHTYGEIIDTLRKWASANEYHVMKENAKAFLSLMRKKVILENWTADSIVLLNFGVSSSDLSPIHQQILSMSNQMPELTYPQVMFAYTTNKKTREEIGKNKKRAELQTFLCDTPKYASIFSSSTLPLYYDYDQALNCANRLNKPLFIDFNGWGCVNCRKMEKTVWQDSIIHNLMMNNFVLVSLYVDDKTLLPENEWKQSSTLNKMIKTLGDKNFEIESLKFKFNAQPHYVVINPDGNQIGSPIGYCNKEDFKLFLQNALKEFQLKK